MGACGRPSLLDEELKEAYRIIVREYAYSWRSLPEREQMMDIVKTAFLRYPVEKIDGIWGCLFNNFRSIMKCRGSNQYKQAHNGGKNRALETGSSVDLSVDVVDDYNACLAIINA